MDLTRVAVLPVGKFADGAVRAEFDAILAVFRRLELHLDVLEPVTDIEEARRSAQALSAQLTDLLLIVTLNGRSAPVIEAAVKTGRIPCLIWPVQGRFALPSSALAAGAIHEAGLPVEVLYAPPELRKSQERAQVIVRTARAYSRMRRSRIGVVGGLFPNLVSCRYDAQKVSSRLGTTLVQVPYEQIRDSIQKIIQDPDPVEALRSAMAVSYKIDPADENAVSAGLRLHLVLKQLAVELNLAGYATKCWSGLPRELGLNPCLGFLEDAYTLACEGDVMLCIALLIARCMTGKAAYAGDLYDLDLDGVLTLVHCGAPASLAANSGEVVLGKSTLAAENGFETISCRPRLEAGPVTLLRFYGPDCDQMHIAAGTLLDSELSPNLTVRVRLTGSRWDFLESCFGNHYVTIAGDLCRELRLLTKWLGITIFKS